MTGKEFERQCIYRMQAEERLGHATMSRYGVQASLVNEQWRPIQSLPDFEGILDGGRQFVFDCKVCSQASLPLNDSHVKERQLRHLLKRGRFGAIAFLAIHFNPRELKTRSISELTVAMPVYPDHPFWRQAEQGEVKRVTRDDCDEHGFQIHWSAPQNGRARRPDLLAAIEDMLRAGAAQL